MASDNGGFALVLMSSLDDGWLAVSSQMQLMTL
jgi:hypothetical protein